MPTHSQDRRETSEVRWISDRIKLVVALAGIVSICGSILGSGWAIRGYIAAWRDEIGAHFTAIENSQMKAANDLATANAAITARWSLGQMQAWSAQLNGANRSILRADGTTGLIAPDPSSIPQRQD